MGGKAGLYLPRMDVNLSLDVFGFVSISVLLGMGRVLVPIRVMDRQPGFGPCLSSQGLALLR